MVSTEAKESSNESEPAWDEALLRNPHAVADKRRRVREMFAAIAPSYDINNRLHSLWMDQYWRRKAVKLAELKADVAGVSEGVAAGGEGGGAGVFAPDESGVAGVVQLLFPEGAAADGDVDQRGPDGGIQVSAGEREHVHRAGGDGRADAGSGV